MPAGGAEVRDRDDVPSSDRLLPSDVPLARVRKFEGRQEAVADREYRSGRAGQNLSELPAVEGKAVNRIRNQAESNVVEDAPPGAQHQTVVQAKSAADPWR